MGAVVCKWCKRIETPIIIFAYLALIPLLSVNMASEIIIFSIYALSYNLLYGFMGRLSVGPMLFLGTGVYGAAMCCVYLTANPVVCIAAGIVCGTLLGMLLGPVTVRAAGAAFALVNMAFNQVGFFMIQTGLAGWTGGSDGKSLSFDPIGPLDFNKPNHVFGLALVCLLATFFIMRRLTESPFGIIIKTIKENERRGNFLGYNIYGTKLLVYVITAAISAFAGALYAIMFGYVTPSFISPARNIEVIFATLIGGRGNIYGSLLGGAIFILVSSYLPNLIQRWELFFGLILLASVFWFSKGIPGVMDLFGPKKQGISASAKGGLR
jgi:branched-chain amino acid transport system permease protein